MIRDMRSTDAPAVTDIFVRSLGYVDTSEHVVGRRLEELAGASHCISLVWEDDETRNVLGFIHALKYETLHNVGGWDVISLAVAPEVQGRGIGGQLLKACEQEVLRREGSFIRLNSSLKRTEAHRFYDHLGYVSGKTQKHFLKRLS